MRVWLRNAAGPLDVSFSDFFKPGVLGVLDYRRKFCLSLLNRGSSKIQSYRLHFILPRPYLYTILCPKTKDKGGGMAIGFPWTLCCIPYMDWVMHR